MDKTTSVPSLGQKRIKKDLDLNRQIQVKMIGIQIEFGKVCRQEMLWTIIVVSVNKMLELIVSIALILFVPYAMILSIKKNHVTDT